MYEELNFEALEGTIVLFIAVLDETTKLTKNNVSLCILFANDIVIVEETRDWILSLY